MSAPAAGHDVADSTSPWSPCPSTSGCEAVEVEAARAFLAANPPGAGAPLAIVIPAYNEEPTVAEVIAGIPPEAAGCRPR